MSDQTSPDMKESQESKNSQLLAPTNNMIQPVNPDMVLENGPHFPDEQSPVQTSPTNNQPENNQTENKVNDYIDTNNTNDTNGMNNQVSAKRVYNLKREQPHVLQAMPKFKVQHWMTLDLPTFIDLTGNCSPITDQGNLGSCTAHAVVGAYEYHLVDGFIGSRLFEYYNARVLDHDVSTDAGSTITTSIQSLKQFGVCKDSLWPYQISRFAQRPPQSAYEDGLNHQVVTADTVNQTLQDLKTCLANGFPIAFGFEVYESFESSAVARTGIVPLPAPNETLLGGHAVLIVGYDDSTQRFKVRNSWGTSWGDHGYFYMPYAYILDTNLAFDFWRITLNEDTNQPAPTPDPTPTPTPTPPQPRPKPKPKPRPPHHGPANPKPRPSKNRLKPKSQLKLGYNLHVQTKPSAKQLLQQAFAQRRHNTAY